MARTNGKKNACAEPSSQVKDLFLMGRKPIVIEEGVDLDGNFDTVVNLLVIVDPVHEKNEFSVFISVPVAQIVQHDKNTF